MLTEDLRFKKDTFWDSFEDGRTYDSFKNKLLPDLYLKTEVPESIKQSFQVVHKLLLHSYCEYRFVEIALTKTMITFEQALKARYSELNSKQFKGKLQPLINWFHKNNHFEINNQEYIDIIRGIRNSQAHPSPDYVPGIMSIQIIEQVCILINDLYEDVAKRKERWKQQEELTALLKEMCSKGAQLNYGSDSHIIHDAIVVFINNLKLKTEYSFAFTPIFELNDKSKLDVPPTLFFIDSNELKISDSPSCIRIHNENNEVIEFTEITSEDIQNKFFNWKKAYEANVQNIINASSVNFWIGRRARKLKAQLHKS